MKGGFWAHHHKLVLFLDNALGDNELGLFWAHHHNLVLENPEEPKGPCNGFLGSLPGLYLVLGSRVWSMAMGLAPTFTIGIPYQSPKGLRKWVDWVPPWFVNRHMVLGLFSGGLFAYLIIWILYQTRKGTYICKYYF